MLVLDWECINESLMRDDVGARSAVLSLSSFVGLMPIKVMSYANGLFESANLKSLVARVGGPRLGLLR